MTGKKPRARGSSDIEFEARIRARELRFQEVPSTDIRPWGGPDHVGGSGSDRKNLPHGVEAGVTYRNVEIDHRILSELLDEDGSNPPDA